MSTDFHLKFIPKIYHVSGKNQFGPVGALVGFSGSGSDPALAPISILENGQTRQGEFEAYVAAVNADPSKVAETSGFGATYGANLLLSMVNESKSLYSAMKGGVVEDPASWSKAIYGETGHYLGENPKATAVEGTAISKYWSVYSDENCYDEVSRLYLASAGDGHAAIAISEAGVDGAYLIEDASAVKADAIPSDFSAAVEEAKTLFAATPLVTIASRASGLYEGAKAVTVSELNEAVASSEAKSDATNAVIASYEVFSDEAKTNSLGIVYRAQLNLEAEYGDEDIVHGGIDFLLGFSGDANSPALSDMVVLSNTFSMGDPLEKNFIKPYNAMDSHTLNDFYSMAQKDKDVDPVNGEIGATYSAHAMAKAAEVEASLYEAAKGGK